MLLEAVRKETAVGDADGARVGEAVVAVKNLGVVAQLSTFQSAMGRGPTGKLEWFDLVPEDVRSKIPKKAAKRQACVLSLPLFACC